MGPIVNMNKCDGDGRCVASCPNQVFELREITDDELQRLSLIGKVKTKIKGRKKAFPVNYSECIFCEQCVSVCHERAIQLEKQ